MTMDRDPTAGRVSWKPGYHGLLEIDPDTGTILRITIEADLRQDDPIQRASMMVEYGPVKISDSTHICPIRSVSVSVSRSEFASHGRLESTNRLQLNDVAFIDYRRFGSESTIITEIPPTAETSGQPTPAPQEAAVQATPEPPASVQQVPQSPAPEQPAPIQPSPAASVAAQPEALKEVQTSAVESLDSLFGDKKKPAGNAPPNTESTSFTMKVTTRSVDVDLVATDKHGKPVTDLKQDQVLLFDNGRQQQLHAFFYASFAPAPAPAPSPAKSVALAPLAGSATQAQDTSTNSTSPATQPKDTSELLILTLFR